MTFLQKTILTCFFIGLTSPAIAQIESEDQLPPVQIAQETFVTPMKGEEVLPDIQRHPKSNPERVIFTQYKLAKTPAPIDQFAKLSPRVERAQDIDKSAMTISEYNRMTNRYNLMNAKEPVVVYTTLQVDEYSSLQNLIVFDELNDKTFFRYPVYNEYIAIVPKGIEKFGRIHISKPAADKMFKDLSGTKYLTAEFILTPEYADRKTPFSYEDNDYWLMLADIAEVRLWSRIDDKNDEENRLVWFYRNPNFKPKDKDGLGGLYSGE